MLGRELPSKPGIWEVEAGMLLRSKPGWRDKVCRKSDILKPWEPWFLFSGNHHHHTHIIPLKSYI